MRKFLLGVLAAVTLYACGEVSAEPHAPSFDFMRQATDSSVVVTAQIFGQADAWRWRVADLSGETTSDSISVEVMRRDTTFNTAFCARGVNYNTDQTREAVGNEACSASFDVPATALQAPDVPDSLKVRVDSVLSHNVLLDSLTEAGKVAIQAGPEIYCPAAGAGVSRGFCDSMEESWGIPHDDSLSWRVVTRSVAECMPEPNCLETGGDSTRAGVPCREVSGPEGTGPETWECAA